MGVRVLLGTQPDRSLGMRRCVQEPTVLVGQAMLPAGRARVSEAFWWGEARRLVEVVMTEAVLRGRKDGSAG